METGLCLISSGIDSPVAASMMLRKGLRLEFLHFSLSLDSHSVSIVKLQLGTLSKLYRQRFILHWASQAYMEDVVRKINPRYTCLICKRMMYRIGEALARQRDLNYLITGENLAQVASQTLSNMIVLSKAVQLPVLRPLLCLDKQETIEIARQLGTYEPSVESKQSCPYLPRYPITHSTPNTLVIEEKKIDIAKSVGNALEGTKKLTIG